MPKYYKKKRVTKKKRGRRTKRKQSLFSAGQSRPLRMKLKTSFRYFTGFTLASGVAGLVNYQTFSANSLYDPDVTGTGHQPAGFDELMSLYFRYQVIGAKIRVNVQNNDPDDPIVVGVYVSTDASPTNQLTGLIEGGQVKYYTLGFGTQAQAKIMTAGANIKKRFSTLNFFGEDVYIGNASASPASQLYFHVFAASPNAGSPAGIPCQVQIDYIAILTDPVSLVSS